MSAIEDKVDKRAIKHLCLISIVILLFIVIPLLLLKPERSKIDFINKSAEDGIKEALTFYKVEHPDIVYALVLISTDNFNSLCCTEYNNLFNFYSDKNKDFYRFRHWTESIVFYIATVQYRYNPVEDTNEEYYEFLSSVLSTKDNSLYIKELKNIVESINY